jgi:Concanavalin A-like lectin/glucanases superfamily
MPPDASIPSPAQTRDDVLPSLAPNLQAFFDFEHPALEDETRELDQGLSGTDIQLINGGAPMRVSDGAYEASRASLRVQQVDEANAGNDDWKAGIFDACGVATLSAFSGARGATIMAWVQLSSDGAALDTNTADPSDRYNALGIAGLLSGNSDGHGARALLELITVNGELRLVALGRRLDAGRSQTFAANDDYRTLLPVGEWVHIAATFDFGIGEMALFRNGQPVGGFYTQLDDPWELTGAVDPTSSPTLPRGIKLGGSYPQNTEEFNPGQSKLDSVMFIDRVATSVEIDEQYLRATSAR